MKKITLASIRSQNIQLVFDLIAKEGRITRSDLAKKTGLSLMTVGNVVDQLDSHRIIRRQGWAGGLAAGRKAELLSVRKEAGKLVILDLTSREFSFEVLELDLSRHQIYDKWRGQKEQDYLANLEDFLLFVQESLNKDKAGQELVGLAVSVPGPYDAEEDKVLTRRIPELTRISLKKTVSRLVLAGGSEEAIFIDEDVKFAALANLALVPEYKDKTIFYAFIGEGMGGAIALDGKVVRGAYSFAGDIGQVLYTKEQNFEDLLALPVFAREAVGRDLAKTSPEEMLAAIRLCQEKEPGRFAGLLATYSARLALALYNVTWFIDPHAIIIECAYASLDSASYLAGLRHKLEQMLPERPAVPRLLLSNRPVKDASTGAGLVLRNRWLERIARPAD